MFYRRFVFGEAPSPEGDICVKSTDLYQPDKGYGFVTEQNRREQELLKLPELNSGFDTVYWFQDEELTHIESDAEGCFLDSDRQIAALEEKTGEPVQGEKRFIPLSFKLDVPHQGNYRVTVSGKGDALIFTGRRRLGYKGRLSQYSMTVNVCDIVPRGHTEAYTDKTIDITIVSGKPRLSAITVEEADCPTIYIAGDSTVTDQSADYPYAPGTSYSGWGQMISAYLNESVAVSNHAHSGLTTDSFRREGHYAIVEQYCKPGDFIFYQFAHNDQKLDELKAQGGYRANLERYIRECREMGAYPVLVTPIARNTWKGNDGAYNDLLEEYAGVCLQVGAAMGVPVLDLHKRSMDFITARGLEASKAYFFPNDYTHSNDYGAYLMAGFVAGEIMRVCADFPEKAYHFLAGCVTKGFGEWKAAEQIILPGKPAIYNDISNPVAAGELLSDVKELEKPASRADVLDMIIKTVRFFPTNVYNDMFEDVVGHEWYAGAVECAYQNGMIDSALVENGHFYPQRAVTMEEFLVFAMNGYRSRKKFPEDAPCAYDGRCRDFARQYVRAAVSVGLLPGDGSADLKHSLTRGEAVELCRKMNV